jgi:dimeric dUTPase (all-alpha-NTP-PPase superfamily)
MEGMDKLERIFELQNAFDTSLEKLRGLEGITTEQWIQKETLAMMSELSELIDEVNFKWWKNPKPLDHGAIKEELVDILHFFVSMCLKVGMDADELYRLYTVKNKENFNRQQGKSDKPGYKAV